MLRYSLWLQKMPHIQEGRPDISKYFGIFCTLGGSGEVSLSLFQRQLIKYLLNAMFCLCVSQQGGTMRLWLTTYSWQIQNSQQLKQLFLPSKDDMRFGRLMQALNVHVLHTLLLLSFLTFLISSFVAPHNICFNYSPPPNYKLPPAMITFNGVFLLLISPWSSLVKIVKEK